MDDDRLDDLEARIAVLEARVGPSDPTTSRDDSVLDAQRFWALEGLKQRLPDGGVLLTGSVVLPAEHEVAAEWQQASRTDALLEADWDGLAGTFAALGHPVRLRLLRAVLNGVTTTIDLADLDDIGTRGQLHHHLRELTATGWLRTAGRGVYEVPAPRIVPLLTMITGAQR